MDLDLSTGTLYEEFSSVFETLNDYRAEFEAVYKSKLEQKGHKASGNLISSINTYTVVGESTVEVYLDCAEYYKYVEKGRKAGKFPPISKILEWIRVKPVIPREMGGKLPTEEQLAFLIARKIANEGIEPSNDLQETVEAVNAKYILLLQDALAKDWQRYAEKIYGGISSIRV